MECFNGVAPFGKGSFDVCAVFSDSLRRLMYRPRGDKHMKYDFIISITFYICGCFYMIFGYMMLAANAKSYVNRLVVIR